MIGIVLVMIYDRRNSISIPNPSHFPLFHFQFSHKSHQLFFCY